MINLGQDIRSLTEFKRDTASFVKRLKRTGSPLVLTVNGRAELVVHDAASYQALLDRAQAIEGIRRGLDSFRRRRSVTLDRSEARMRRKNGIK